MKFFIQLLFLLTLVAIASLQTECATNQTSLLVPSYCPNKCGSIGISYPFGVSAGCFRPGFELFCDKSSNPPKLFTGNDTTFQITGINSSVQATTGITIMPSNVKMISVTWTSGSSGPYTLLPENTLTAIGCHIKVQLTDSNRILAQCMTSCDSADSLLAANGSCNNIGCCQIGIPHRLTTYMYQITRIEAINNLSHDYDVKAFISSDEYTFMPDDVYSGRRYNRTTRVKVALDWNIPSPRTCQAAKKQASSYACLAEGSYCNDETGMGYYCSCPSGGNPYIPGGCNPKDHPVRRMLEKSANAKSKYSCYCKANPRDPYSGVPSSSYNRGGSSDPNFPGPNITKPSSDCQKKCGNTDIPFPFGLKDGCYRNEEYALKCTEASPPILLFSYFCQCREYWGYQVDQILIEDGQLRVNTTNASMQARERSDKPFFYYSESGLFNWVIDYTTCEQAKTNKTSYACIAERSSCITRNLTEDDVGYYCKCNQGYEGNPYLIQGCKDIDECGQQDKYLCNGTCLNFDGGYICCPPGTFADSTSRSCRSSARRKLSVGVYVAFGIGIGLICLVICVSMFFCRRMWLQRIERKKRLKNFYQNKGVMLQQLNKCNEDGAEKTRIFSLRELEKATDNFDESRIVGRGGHGNVFKGMLSDQSVVAIKKSKVTVKREIEQFINEVVILSRINHRNIVKLFGCCLETEVPLLVYEFITNGTLYNHLHSVNSKSMLSWEARLRIASETAGALSYLHTSASISIYHRDVKSTNILLDEYFTVKVSDFGASRFIPIDQTQVATDVQGTRGYLDPEYHHTGQLTEKSDVYSFGIILVELLTGEMPISNARGEEDRYLSRYFLRTIEDNRVSEIVDAQVKEESNTDELGEFIHLAEVCLRLKGEERPTMKEVEFKLQSLVMIRKQKKEQGTIPCFPTEAPQFHAENSTAAAVSVPRDDDLIASENHSAESLSLPR